MPRPAPQFEAPDRRQMRYQFGLTTILLLMTIVAIAVAVVRPIPLPPAWRPYAIGAIVLWISYLVMRTAFILRRMNAHRRYLRNHRQDLLRWADEIRAESTSAGGDDPSTAERP